MLFANIDKMLVKLRSAEEKYVGIEAELASPEIFANNERYTRLMKEYKALTPIIIKYREYCTASAELCDIEKMLEEHIDAELRDLAYEELHICREKCETILQELKK